jgi:hypothetical protein
MLFLSNSENQYLNMLSKKLYTLIKNLLSILYDTAYRFVGM